MASQKRFKSQSERDQALARFYNNLSDDESDVSDPFESESSDGKIFYMFPNALESRFDRVFFVFERARAKNSGKNNFSFIFH